MLLSLLSRRSLEVDSRDAYGFAVRPQNIQTYREYVNIYKQEEDERFEKWKIFLEHLAKPTEPHPSEKEDSKTLQGEAPGEINKVCLEEINKVALPEEAREVNEEAASEKQHEVTLQTDAASEEESKETFQGKAMQASEQVDSSDGSKETSHTEATESKEEAASEKQHEVTLQTDAASEEESKETFQGEAMKASEQVDSSDGSKETSHTEATESKEEATSEMQHEVTLKTDAASEEESKETFQGEAMKASEQVDSSDGSKETSHTEATESKEEAAFEKQHEVTLKTDAASEEESKETFQGEAMKASEQVDSSESKETSHTEATESKEEAASEVSREGDTPRVKLDSVSSIESEIKKPDSAGFSKSESQKLNSAHSTESGREKEVQHTEERKARKVNRWGKTRPALCAIENLMSLRVKRKKMKNMNTNGSGYNLPSTKEAISLEGNSEDKFEEKVCDNEISDREGSNADNEAYDESFFPWKEELQSLVHGGVPKDLRGEVWQVFVGVKARRVERYYDDLLAQENRDDERHSNSSDVFGKWRKQIEKDIPRTFPGHPALNDRGRDSLRRLLLAYARHNPSVGYCQAMNFFAGLLLLLMPEENAFWTLVGIIDDYFDGYFTEEMIESQVDQLVFEDLIRERFPTLVNHLDDLGVQVAWISTSWFLTIFVNMLPWESVLRIWDVILFEGNRVMLFRTALALMELHAPALVTTKDAGDAITLLQSLAGSTFDSSQLVLIACMGFLAVNDGKLRELREKHRPTILMIAEERAKGAQVSKESQGIVSKLYSFKKKHGQKETNPAEDNRNSFKLEPRSSDLDELLCSLNADLEVGSLPSLQDQVDRMKVELCRLLEEKRADVLRAEELEMALMELKEDNRRELIPKIEQLEEEVADLQQALALKKDQEAAMVKVMMQLEQEKKIVEDARRNAEIEASALREVNRVLQEKYEEALNSNAEMEKRMVMAESMLEAKSGQPKPQTSPQSQQSNSGRMAEILKFGLGWRDKSKRKPDVEEPTDSKSSPSATQEETNPEDHEKSCS